MKIIFKMKSAKFRDEESFLDVVLFVPCKYKIKTSSRENLSHHSFQFRSDLNFSNIEVNIIGICLKLQECIQFYLNFDFSGASVCNWRNILL